VKLLAFDQEDGSVWFQWAGRETVARLERNDDGSWSLRRPGREDVFIQPPGVLHPANRTQAHGMVSIEIADKLAPRRRDGRHRARALEMTRGRADVVEQRGPVATCVSSA
jgi:hypothetical protein